MLLGTNCVRLSDYIGVNNMKQTRPLFFKAFLQEILLYSGQFALFYLLMQLIIEGKEFIHNINHIGLLFALIIQTCILAKYGKKIFYRALFPFLVPIIYSLLEMLESSSDLLNAAHIGFWIYAILSSALMLFGSKFKKTIIYEILLIIINILIFIFLYFYFDTWKQIQNKESLIITKIFDYIPLFLNDQTHWFIIIGGAFLATTIVLSRIEVEQLKSKIYSLFGKYVDTSIRDIIIEHGEIVSEKKELCIVFSDIKNFTQLCEKNEPESITKMLNTFFDEWNVLVKKHNGTVDKYIGDAIMIIFGLQNNANACDSAILCAIEMDNKWDEIKRDLIKNGLPAPDGFGIGLHYGEAIIGDIGSSDRKNFTVIGDAVNIASRLESETRKHSCRLLISSSVFNKLIETNKKKFNEIGSIELKGKEKKISAFVYKSAEVE